MVLTSVLKEAKRVLTSDGTLVCSVPVPERKELQSTIRGTLHSEMEWKRMCQGHGLRFEPIDAENGALLYFKAVKP